MKDTEPEYRLTLYGERYAYWLNTGAGPAEAAELAERDKPSTAGEAVLILGYHLKQLALDLGVEKLLTKFNSALAPKCPREAKGYTCHRFSAAYGHVCECGRRA